LNAWYSLVLPGKLGMIGMRGMPVIPGMRGMPRKTGMPGMPVLCGMSEMWRMARMP